MKKKVYIETTVVSYLTAKPSRDLLVAGHQQATRELWPKLCDEYETFVSALVYEEGRRGDCEQAQLRLEAIKAFRMLAVEEDAQVLAQKLIDGCAVPAKYPEDALHIAIAAVNGVDVIVTWNFAHLNNPFTRALVRQVVETAGFVCPEICSPEELLEIN